MSGRILVVDELAANRIVLKAKLSAAYYEVEQAASGREALDLVARNPPDLILASSGLSDYPGPALVPALHASATGRPIPVVLLMPEGADASRIAALESGADDVIAKPVSDRLLLARLRCLLRQQHAEHDLSLHFGAAQALGFADQQTEFAHRGRIAFVTRPGRESQRLQALLRLNGNSDIVAMPAETAIGPTGNDRRPDVFVLSVPFDGAEEKLRLMADLKAAPRTRHCPVIAVMAEPCEALATTLLDMGASDILLATMHPREFRIRIARQLKNKQTADQLRHQLRNGLNAAVIDPLTGAYNRRYALPYLDRLIDTAGKEGREFAVMVADLDFFKRINDRFGHAAGDEVLSRVAGLLRTSLGDDGLVARIGGEEFLMILPDVSRQAARAIADNLCRIVRDTPTQIAGRQAPLYVTISIGVTIDCGDRGLRPTVDNLLEEADRALYGAKARGRNTVSLCARTAA